MKPLAPVGRALIVLGLLLFLVPPVVAGVLVDGNDSEPGMGVDDLEGLTAGLIVAASMFVGFLLMIFGAIAAGALDESRRPSPPPHAKGQTWPREDLGLHVDGKWMCFEHDIVDCPVCLTRSRAPAAGIPLSGIYEGKWMCCEHHVVECPDCWPQTASPRDVSAAGEKSDEVVSPNR